MIDLKNQHTLLRVRTGYIKIIENFCVIYRTKFAEINGTVSGVAKTAFH